MKEDFYIGWETEAAPGIRRRLRGVVLALSVLAVAVSLVLAASQRMIGQSVFEWGTTSSFSGILQTQPYPQLWVPRPGRAGPLPEYSTYYLVAPWKFGLKHETIAPFEGASVTLKGALIYRDGQTMIETKPEWIQRSDRTSAMALPQTVRLGRQTLVGEIVDSKCFLGVMNPGQLTPHRACAIRCISGGIPPILVVRQKNGPPAYLLLVSADGKPVNQQVLRWVAEPVEITGELERQGALLILRADPATYRRPG